MGKDSETSIGWRILWAVVGGGLAMVVLSVSGLELGLPVMIGIAAVFAVAVAFVGPALLEVLAAAS